MAYLLSSRQKDLDGAAKKHGRSCPSFTHIKRACLPLHIFDGVLMRLIAGDDNEFTPLP